MSFMSSQDGGGLSPYPQSSSGCSLNILSSDEWASRLEPESLRLFKAASKCPIVADMSPPLPGGDFESHLQSTDPSLDIDSPKDSSDPLQCIWSPDGTSLFAVRSSRLTKVCHSEQILSVPPESGMSVDSVFMSRRPFMEASLFCGEQNEECKDCPRCGRLCIREFTISDAVMCAWCYFDGAANGSCWFCWKCCALTGDLGKDDPHYYIWDCGGARDKENILCYSC